MKLPPFDLERWFARYEFEVKNNMCASCASPTTTGELLELAGGEAVSAYLKLGLDYIENPGTARLKQAICRWYHNLTPEHIQVTTGASEAIFILMNTLLAPGDVIIVESPIYQSLYQVALEISAEVRFWPLQESNGFLPDPDELKKLLSPKVKMVVVNHPHSPTGSVISGEIQSALLEMAGQHGFLLVSDEVYRDIVYHPDHNIPSAADLSPFALSLGDMTKPFGLGGLRVGWVASQNRDILNAVSSFRDYTTMCSSAPGEYLAALALENREALLAKKIEIAKINLSLLQQFMEDHADLLAWVPPGGGFSAFPRYKLGLDSYRFCSGLVQQESMLLLPGDAFGVEKHFRIGFGRETGSFKEGLEALHRYMQTFRVH